LKIARKQRGAVGGSRVNRTGPLSINCATCVGQLRDASISPMRFLLAAALLTGIFALDLIAAPVQAPAFAAERELRIGVGFDGPISNETSAQITQMVNALPNLHAVPIVIPGDAAACVKRFVAGDVDDRLDGVITFKLPQDSFKTERNEKEVTFSGTYEISTLNLSTVALDSHDFTVTDSEPVVSGIAALVAVPAELVSERAAGKKLISSSAYQASQAVQARVESKLITATKLYLADSPLSAIKPLDPTQPAQALVDVGDGETAMAVYKSIGVNNPQVDAMVAKAREQIARSHSTILLGQALGAIAAGDATSAQRLSDSYAKDSTADPARSQGLRAAISALSRTLQGPPNDQISRSQIFLSDVPGLDQAAFASMVKQVFTDATGSQPQTVEASSGRIDVNDKAAEAGLKTSLDLYAMALAKTAWLMSLRCGCAAEASLRAQSEGPTLIRAHFDPSSNHAQVGLP
jgi:hypothetical protein